MGRREINVEIFQDTTEFLNESEKLLTATAETRRKQKLMYLKFCIRYQSRWRSSARIFCTGGKSL